MHLCKAFAQEVRKLVRANFHQQVPGCLCCAVTRNTMQHRAPAFSPREAGTKGMRRTRSKFRARARARERAYTRSGDGTARPFGVRSDIRDLLVRSLNPHDLQPGLDLAAKARACVPAVKDRHRDRGIRRRHPQPPRDHRRPANRARPGAERGDADSARFGSSITWARIRVTRGSSRHGLKP